MNYDKMDYSMMNMTYPNMPMMPNMGFIPNNNINSYNNLENRISTLEKKVSTLENKISKLQNSIYPQATDYSSYQNSMNII